MENKNVLEEYDLIVDLGPVKDEKEFTQHKPEGFIKDSKRWVIFPRLSFMNHQKIEARNRELSDVFSSYDKNKIHPSCETFKDSKKGIATGGISYTYAMETLKNTGMVKNLKVATPHPFPEKLAVEFLTGLDEVTLSLVFSPAQAVSPLSFPRIFTGRWYFPQM